MLSILSNIPMLVLSIFSALLALSIHEASHAYAAYKLGDPTAKNFGRLTINPLKHLDLFGVLCMIFFRFGWAKPVPINPRNFKNPRRDFAISALAGPLSNIISAFFACFLFILGLEFITPPEDAFLYSVCENTLLFLQIFTTLNLGLGVFNLIPFPPFDGSRIVYAVLPPKLYFGVMRYEKYIYWGVIAWLLLGPYVADAVRALPFVSSNVALNAFASVFSLSELISLCVESLYNLMLSLFGLLPFITII